MAMTVHPFTGARKARPTLKHRPAIWECMLGAVYAMNAAGETRYFDYDYAAARAFAGVDVPGGDLRLANLPARRCTYSRTGSPADEPRRGRPVLWVLR